MVHSGSFLHFFRFHVEGLRWEGAKTELQGFSPFAPPFTLTPASPQFPVRRCV